MSTEAKHSPAFRRVRARAFLNGLKPGLALENGGALGLAELEEVAKRANAHDALVEALEATQRYIGPDVDEAEGVRTEGTELAAKIRAALALARP